MARSGRCSRDLGRLAFCDLLLGRLPVAELERYFGQATIMYCGQITAKTIFRFEIRVFFVGYGLEGGVSKAYSWLKC